MHEEALMCFYRNWEVMSLSQQPASAVCSTNAYEQFFLNEMNKIKTILIKSNPLWKNN